MFDELLKMNGQQHMISIETDEKGYLDRKCPSKNCNFMFKINGEDWKNIVKGEAVWCPSCQHEAHPKDWDTLEQEKQIEEEGAALITGKLTEALRADVDNFNRSQSKNSFLSVSAKFKESNVNSHVNRAKATEIMPLDVQCEKCNCRFAVMEEISFCPACGCDIR